MTTTKAPRGPRHPVLRMGDGRWNVMLYRQRGKRGFRGHGRPGKGEGYSLVLAVDAPSRTAARRARNAYLRRLAAEA